MALRADYSRITQVLQCSVCGKNEWKEEGERSPVRFEKANRGFQCGHVYHLACMGKKFNKKIIDTEFSYFDLFFTKRISRKIVCEDNRFQACNQKRSISQVFTSPRCFTLYQVWKRCYSREDPCLGKIVLHEEGERRASRRLTQEGLIAQYGSAEQLEGAAHGRDGQVSLQGLCNLKPNIRAFEKRKLKIFDKLSIFGSTLYHTIYVTITLAIYWLFCALDLYTTSRRSLKRKAYRSIGELYLKIFIKKYPKLYLAI